MCQNTIVPCVNASTMCQFVIVLLFLFNLVPSLFLFNLILIFVKINQFCPFKLTLNLISFIQIILIIFLKLIFKFIIF